MMQLIRPKVRLSLAVDPLICVLAPKKYGGHFLSNCVAPVSVYDSVWVHQYGGNALVDSKRDNESLGQTVTSRPAQINFVV